MRKLFILLFSTLSISVFAQQHPVWHSGSVVLEDGQVLAGEMVVHIDFGTLLVKSADQLIVLPPHKINFFRYYDEAENINRQFISMNVSGSKNKMFYELVVKGDYQIVRRVRHAHISKPAEIDDYSYFVLHQKNLVPIAHFKKEIIPGLVASNPTIADWVNENKLDVRKRETAILVLKEYNRLSHSKHLVALR